MGGKYKIFAGDGAEKVGGEEVGKLERECVLVMILGLFPSGCRANGEFSTACLNSPWFLVGREFSDSETSPA